jgi:microcin C transport system substrate-binding protein
VQDYDWRLEPTTAAYHYRRIEKGRFIELERTENWWGDELKYYKNRFNFDTLRIDIIRDDNVAFEYFLRGDLDSFLLNTPTRWHEKAVGEPFDKGYIHKIQFYNDLPRDSRGLWLNMDVPLLADKNVRYGLAHAMNWDAVLRNVLRGDFTRLRMHYEGYYWGYSNPNIQPRPFDLALADQYFNAAGWTQRGPDGIRTKDGQRLAVNVSYYAPDTTPQLVLLREEAKKAGVELNLQILDFSAWGNQIAQKKHEIVALRYGTGLIPTFWQHYHSDNAHIPQTNNITATDDPEIDRLSDEFDAATTLEDRLRLSHRLQELVHDVGAFIPSYKTPFLREGYWRWIRLPAHYGTRISSEDSGITDPFGLGLAWFDEELKNETLAAQAEGRSFGPVVIVDDTWRVD